MLVVLVVAWLSVAAVGVVVMHRRGHDPFSWGLLFLVFGPLAIPLAVSAERHIPPEPPCPPHGGELDVLVVHDGSPEAGAALDAALRLLDRDVTSLTLAMVVDVEATTTVRGRTTMDEARRRLEVVAARLESTVRAPVDTVVLHGEPAHVLQRYASEHGYEVIVVNAPRSSHALAKVARRLVACASVPVLVAPSTP